MSLTFAHSEINDRQQEKALGSCPVSAFQTHRCWLCSAGIPPFFVLHHHLPFSICSEQKEESPIRHPTPGSVLSQIMVVFNRMWWIIEEQIFHSCDKLWTPEGPEGQPPVKTLRG